MKNPIKKSLAILTLSLMSFIFVSCQKDTLNEVDNKKTEDIILSEGRLIFSSDKVFKETVAQLLK